MGFRHYLLSLFIIKMSVQQSPLDIQLESIIKDSLPGLDPFPKKTERVDEQEVTLISKDPQQQSHEQILPPPEVIEVASISNDIIDPLQELVKNNDVVPLLAVIDKINIDIDLEGKPLISRLCTMHIPLSQILAGRDIVFRKDEDNRTALHQAIASGNTSAAYWCLENRIGNSRDNFGNTPILQAIRLGRKDCFLLCLHYQQYYDTEAPHVCATFNRAWEIKVLHRMGYDVLSQRDSQHYSPFQRAVQNYSYDVSEYLSQISTNVNVKQLQSKTDSKGIMRLIKRVRHQISFTNLVLMPIVYLMINVFLIFQASSLPIFQGYHDLIKQSLGLILGLQVCLYFYGWITSETAKHHHPDLLRLLKAPQFPPMEDICAQCMDFMDVSKDHCKRCNSCVTRHHFHEVVCVNINNEVIWFLIEICWTWLVWKMHHIIYDTFKVNHLKILNFSSNWFFGNMSSLQNLYLNENYTLLLLFLYLKIFMIYQFCSMFQWLVMLTLKRSYRQVNNSEKYKRLYQVAVTPQGSFKSVEIRLLENGLILGIGKAVKNILTYFFS